MLNLMVLCGQVLTIMCGKYPFNPPLVNNKGYYNENPLSIAFKISYGLFDYYVGGDISGVNKYPDYDIETPMANIVGQVEAMTLDHHGHKDATNHYFLSQLKPQVIAHQSLHDPHFAENVQYNLKISGADVYSPYVGDTMKEWYKKWMKKSYKSTEGHFFIRVYPDDYSFEVFVLNETQDGYTLKFEYLVKIPIQIIDIMLKYKILIFLFLCFMECSNNDDSAQKQSTNKSLNEIIDQMNNPSEDYVLVASHRGNWQVAPENSLESIQSCN